MPGSALPHRPVSSAIRARPRAPLAALAGTPSPAAAASTARAASRSETSPARQRPLQDAAHLVAEHPRHGRPREHVLHRREHAEHALLLGPQVALGHQLLPHGVVGDPGVHPDPGAPPARQRLADEFQQPVEDGVPGAGVQVGGGGDALVVGADRAGPVRSARRPAPGGGPGRCRRPWTARGPRPAGRAGPAVRASRWARGPPRGRGREVGPVSERVPAGALPGSRVNALTGRPVSPRFDIASVAADRRRTLLV
ncbi:hypothetical protein STENM223S_05869 [Streptomyces tendae]